MPKRQTKSKPVRLAFDLERLFPLKPSPADHDFLDGLQANILKGHGRNHTANLFFEIVEPVAARAWLSQIKVTSSTQQFEDAETFKATGGSGRALYCFMLSALGYQALGFEITAFEHAFQAGMTNRKLNDPNPKNWEVSEAHAMLLIADISPELVRKALTHELKAAGAAIRVLQIDYGLAQRVNGEGIEHFGYVDGRSQPLALQSDLMREAGVHKEEHIRFKHFDPRANLSQVVVPDPHQNGHFGSYFVYRKLEQNVAGFKAREEYLASQLGLFDADAERAGALIVGRFEDGTPVVEFNTEQTPKPVPNDFNYAHDPLGQRCPFHAHIRKTNPRTNAAMPYAPTTQRLMFRRGITYGERPDLTPESEHKEGQSFPSGDVGLLFQAYMQSIEEQFEFAQRKWANDENGVLNGPQAPTGLDGVIGQNPGAAAQNWSTGHGEQQCRFDFRGFVRLLGGGYFFAQSLAWIRALSKSS